MAQLSGKAAAIKNERCGFISGQFALQLFKLGVREADRRRNVAFIEFGFFGTRIHKNGLIVFVPLGNILN